ncbi:NAD-dependent epimerase/dehydratase family protein [Methylobacillus glycogenes]|uniref:NAD-dependent epimerase/dehydratase family protein n=1 Tax=Methylobacillus glycogenes TaxID=406 RepID=UPI0018FF174E|nr:NAD-dependent epimerase/dehydratase family protein [Methylobacillus glycogenes]
MKVIVIGGSGLIGKQLVSVLQQQGHDVIAASRSTGINSVTGTAGGSCQWQGSGDRCEQCA